MDKKILSIKEIQELALAGATIEIPDFQGTGGINIRVQQPRLMSMVQQGKIPNHLIAVATSMLTGGKIKDADKKKDEEKLKLVDNTMELYCIACMVEPSYEEFKDIMTDDQKNTIFLWATGQISTLDTFRDYSADGENNTDGEKIQSKTKPVDGDK